MRIDACFKKVKEEEFLNAYNNKDSYNNLKLPRRATSGSAGYDFFSPFDFTLKEGEEIKIPTGIKAIFPSDYVLMIFPRSSLGFKYQLMLANTVGIIDSDYQFSDNDGHIFVKLINRSNKVLEIKQGEAIVQGIFLNFGICLDDEVLEKRNGGFGSTNK